MCKLMKGRLELFELFRPDNCFQLKFSEYELNEKGRLDFFKLFRPGNCFQLKITAFNRTLFDQSFQKNLSKNA